MDKQNKPIVDISGQKDYSAEEMRQEIVELRRFVIDTVADRGASVPADEVCRRLAVLNWLADDVEIVKNTVTGD